MFKFIARSLLGSIFVVGGLGAAQKPESRIETVKKAAQSVGVALDEQEAESVIKANGLVMVGAGATMALGILPRLSALTLIASLVPTTLAGHPFWEQDDPQVKALQRVNFFKNIAITGGLMLVLGGGGKTRK